MKVVSLEEARSFLQRCYLELNKDEIELQRRLDEVKQEINQTGSYTHTYEELAHGARMAWRNSNRCIGRLFWQSMHVLDERVLETEEEIAEALFYHMEYGTNSGKVIPTITIFAPKLHEIDRVRIWNHQLIRYAGYETDQGVIGDPDSIDFTKVCINLGWKGNETAFDVLPLVIQIGNRKPQWFSIPERCLLEVKISHPSIEMFTQLGLRWYAVPFIADMRLEIGGISYTAAPFNGWYMGTEIGARNLADETRYRMLPKVAEILELDQSRDSSLWKDRALVELNVAVLHSYKEAGVSIVDHHTAAKQFKQFQERENQVGRSVTGKWSWLIPPLSPATTSIFHQPFKDQIEKPNYFYQARLY